MIGFKSNLPKEVIDAAKAAHKKWGVPASISLAQFILESGWGAHMPPDSFNPFGIKAVDGQPFVAVKTREWSKEKGNYYITAKFRKFADFNEAFDLHAKLLGTSKYYAKARSMLPDVNAFANCLTGVYATDPNYGTALVKIMQSNDLYRFDKD